MSKADAKPICHVNCPKCGKLYWIDDGKLALNPPLCWGCLQARIAELGERNRQLYGDAELVRDQNTKFREQLTALQAEVERARGGMEQILAVTDPKKIIPIIKFYDCEECEEKDKIAIAYLTECEKGGEDVTKG